jgi:Zn-dependent protease
MIAARLSFNGTRPPKSSHPLSKSDEIVMHWSVTLGRFAGTAVKIHFTFLLFLAWIGFSAYQRGGWQAAQSNVLYIVAIFACVVLHEFGHILTARRYGIASKEVTLLPIGGVADLTKMPEKPYQELLIALAGPAVNLVIAAALLLGLQAFEPMTIAHLDDPRQSIVERLAATNLFLALFNLIPAFPMDGGRVLRALLAMLVGHENATRVAVLIGQVFALALGFFGLAYDHPLLMFIALFVFVAGAGEARATMVAHVTREVRVADAMETQVAPIAAQATLGEAVDVLLATSHEAFPLVTVSGALAGLLSREDILSAIRTAEPGAPIGAYVHQDYATIDPAASLEEALQALGDAPAVAVVGADGALHGLVTRRSLADVLLIKSVRPDWRLARR